MNKNIKRLLCVIMVMTMAISVMACGSKSNAKKLSSEEIFTNVFDASKDVKGVSGKANLDVKVSVSGMEMTVSGDAEIKSITEPLQASAKVNAKVNVLGQEQAMSYEMYEVTSDDGSTIDTYMYDGNDWEYESLDVEENSEIADKMEDIISSIDYSEVEKYFDKVNSKVSGKNYVVNMEVSSDNLIKKLEESEYSSALENIDTSSIPNVKIKVSLTVDGKTFLPKKMTVEVNSESIEYQGMEIEVEKCILTYTFDSYDNTEIVVPEEALEAKDK